MGGTVFSSCFEGTENKAEEKTTHLDVNKNQLNVAADATQGSNVASSSTRARRLSVVSPKQGEDIAAIHEPQSEEAPSEPTIMKEEDKEAGKKASENTRNRRLSVVTSQVSPTNLSATITVELRQEIERKLELESMKKDTPKAQSEEDSVQFKRIVSRSPSSKTQISFESEVACISKTGREIGVKKTNQDNCLAFEKFVRNGHSLFAAFDGHGSQGHNVSSFVKHHLPLLLTQQLSKLGRTPKDDQIKRVLHDAFFEVHQNLLQTPIDVEFSGTTATVGYLMGRKLFVAWVGDSRCVLGVSNSDGEIIAKDLTTDHKPDNESERTRIEKQGGRVQRLTDEFGAEIGPWRVWAKYAWIPGLAMSRAIGDECAHQVGVISEPDITVTDITHDVKFAIFASDGVWEFVSSEEAVDIIKASSDPTAGCRRLIDESYHRWLMEENGVVDDITAVVVRFRHLSNN